MPSTRRPSEEIPKLPAWKYGIEETRAKPRPWLWNEEEARKHRLEHPSLWRRLLRRIGSAQPARRT